MNNYVQGKEPLTPKQWYSERVDEVRAEYDARRIGTVLYIGVTSVLGAVGFAIGHPEMGAGTAAGGIPMAAYHGLKAIKAGNFVAAAEALELHEEYEKFAVAEQTVPVPGKLE
jgi:hypothetical protein